jgi:hypothetical protein
MDPAVKKILVAGDAAVDWFLYPVEARDEGENWRLHRSSHGAALPGGVLLLRDFLTQSLQAAGVEAEVVGPVAPMPLRDIPPDQVLHSNAIVGRCRLGRDKKEMVLRVRESLGFMGPPSGSPQSRWPETSDVTPDILVLDDPGNGFRDDTTAWPRALERPSREGLGSAIVVHKISRPIARGRLWAALKSRKVENHIVVVHARDLRQTSGVDISAALSWERTARNCVFQLQRSERLQALAECTYLIVLFGTDGALLYAGRERRRATLIFDPLLPEGGFAARIEGQMYGLTTVVTAALVSEIAEHGIAALEGGLKRGLACARVFLESGFEQSSGVIAYPVSRIFAKALDGSAYASCPIEPATDLHDPDPGYWRILEQQTRNTRHQVAEEIVVFGQASGLRGVPVGVFGYLETIDRAEIESYGVIRELIVEFLTSPKPPRPLCLAVFGPPGSGKSFGVKQVAKSIHSDDLFIVTFNISQFGDYKDLVAAFHTVRDISLRGKIPFVFFDEFDSPSQEGPLGWLKYFLAPMQDAEFKEDGAIHPIGKAIFVFAGGTRSSFENFVRNRPDEEADADPIAQRLAERSFRNAKGTDFVSRLRGFINVMGPNRQHESDDAFIIRRAKVLRILLKQNPRAAGLFDSKGQLRIDAGVLRALLTVGEYWHGTRSLEALLDMSRLIGKRRFDLSGLPPRDQLELHVDADEFLFIAERERYQSLLLLGKPGGPGSSAEAGPGGSYREREEAIIEAVARLIHAEYTRQRILAGEAGTLDDFDNLIPEKKKSNRDAAEDIPAKLRAIGHGLRRIPNGKEPLTPDISDDEVKKLARREHDRWSRDQELQGFVLGPERDPVKKTNPYLVPFEELPPHVQQYDIQAIYAIPLILKTLGYEIYRMKEVEELEDPELIQRLARAIHGAYCEERKREGDNAENNPSMVDYELLSEDLRRANLDNAAAIPRKLQLIGYGIRRCRPGQEPAKLLLEAQDIVRMAILEHDRWNWQKRLQGWVYDAGPKNEEQKTTPYLVPWPQLDPKIQDYDRQTVALIPELLAAVGYEAYRLS